MTGPMENYLNQLRASLPTRPAETSRILAEAEDHLRESVAAGLRAGLTEAEAQEAAISAFGSVRAVARAHQTGPGRAVAVLSGGVLTSSKLAGLFLLAFSACSLVLLPSVAVSPVLQHVAAGIAGLLLLAGGRRARRFRGRRARAAAASAASAARYFPLVAVSFFGAGALTQVLLWVVGAAPIGGPPILACLALAVGYAIRTRWTPRSRDTAA